MHTEILSRATAGDTDARDLLLAVQGANSFVRGRLVNDTILQQASQTWLEAALPEEHARLAVVEQTRALTMQNAQTAEQYIKKVTGMTRPAPIKMAS